MVLLKLHWYCGVMQVHMYLGSVSVNFLGSLWQKQTECSKCVSVFEDQTHQLSHPQFPLPCKPQTLHTRAVRVNQFWAPPLAEDLAYEFVWMTFKQNSDHSLKKISLISYRLFMCLIWHQKVVKHHFKSIFLEREFLFLHILLPEHPSALGL